MPYLFFDDEDNCILGNRVLLHGDVSKKCRLSNTISTDDNIAPPHIHHQATLLSTSTIPSTSSDPSLSARARSRAHLPPPDTSGGSQMRLRSLPLTHPGSSGPHRRTSTRTHASRCWPQFCPCAAVTAEGKRALARPCRCGSRVRWMSCTTTRISSALPASSAQACGVVYSSYGPAFVREASPAACSGVLR